MKKVSQTIQDLSNIPMEEFPNGDYLMEFITTIDMERRFQFGLQTILVGISASLDGDSVSHAEPL